MSLDSAKEARLNFRLTSELKNIIEEAAAALGQSVSDYAISTLVKDSQRVLERNQATKLSTRDRQRFVALLDETKSKPNRALSQAAQRYKKKRTR